MKIPKRRRREGKTDYLKRIKLLKGGFPRIVFRKTNRYIIAQYVTSKEALDKVELSVNSKMLLKYGWPENLKGSLKSTPASYFTGLLIGKKIAKRNLEKSNIILDFGMYRALHKSRIYAFLKGVVDSGINVKYKEETFPGEERIKGSHMKKDFSDIFNKVKSKVENE